MMKAGRVTWGAGRLVLRRARSPSEPLSKWRIVLWSTLSRRVRPVFYAFSFLALFFSTSGLQAESISDDLIGDWTLYLSSGEEGWISASEENGEPSVCMEIDTGSINPRKGVEVKDGHVLFRLKTVRVKRGGPILHTDEVDFWYEDGQLVGHVFRKHTDGKESWGYFKGKKLPAMPPAPDLMKVKFL